jgi:hypothetical protein
MGYSGLIIKVIAQRSYFHETIFSHEGREANGEAHKLDAWLLLFDLGRHVWLRIPINIVV